MKFPRPFSSFLAVVLATALFAASTIAASAAQYDQRLANLSSRAQVGTGANILITGFVVNEGAPKKVLIRAVGQRLSQAPFGMTGTLTNPTLSLFDGSGRLVLQNDNWNSTDNDQVALAAATTAAGAFSLGTSANNDSALVATLSPGAYTAQVSGVSNTSGIAMLEVYDLTGSARLINLSTRAVVAAGNGILISGLVVAPSSGTRRVLIRAAGPALTPLGVAGVVADPVFSIFSGATVIPGGSNDNWDSGTAANTAALVAAATQSGAFPFNPGTKDAALIIDLVPGNYTIQVAGVGNTGGVALVEIYDLTPELLSTVGVAATVASTDAKGASPVVFTLTRVGNLSAAINVAYSLAGTAQSGVDYVPVSGVASFAAGASTATVALVPKSNASNLNNRTATLTIVADKTYGVSINDAASASFYSNTGSLYVSNLRTPAGVTGSTAYGTATVLLAPDEKSAFVNVSFSNLSSPEVVAHLQIDGNYVYNLPQGQVSNAYWDFAPTGTYSTADLIAALKAGRITVSIDSATFTTGELAGNFVKNSGSSAFNTPAAAPAIDLSKVTAQDAARFLTQATFGPKNDEIYALTNKGYTAWFNEQMALPASIHFAEASADFALNNANGAGGSTGVPNTRLGLTHRQHAWWKLAVNAPDQLRQRVAFALSEILVTSDANSTISAWQDGHTNYYDILVRGAFGNFRKLLEDVTLSPNMGIYLSSLRNAKATFNAQGVQLTQPDENYAREVMQLFTIGLNQLQPDGTLKLDNNGQPIPTYTQDTIVQMAKVFTGWGFYQSSATPTFRGTGPGSESYLNPMILFPASHDDTVKVLAPLSEKSIPASQGGAQDLKDALDLLFNHANTGPFISRQLIQRLVTSNPSPGYVYRVASVFANNGAGVRGDLAAVIRAILTDYEARSSAVLNTAGYGKAKEPILRISALLRAFNGTSDGGRYTTTGNGPTFITPDTLSSYTLAQAAGRAPTVFNFFEPDYVFPGALATAGLYAPEFQLLTDTTAISVPNFLYQIIYATRSVNNVGLTLTDILPLAKSPQQLVDYTNLVLSGGSMPKSLTDVIVSAITRMPASTSDLDKVRSAIYLTVSSSEGAVQK